MTDREKQIAELSKEICNGCRTRHNCENNDGFCIMSDVVAEWLLNKGYRKMDEVTLKLNLGDRSAEEIEQIAEMFNGEIKKQVVKEILQKLFNEAYSRGWAGFCFMIQDIAKKYGAEIDE